MQLAANDSLREMPTGIVRAMSGSPALVSVIVLGLEGLGLIGLLVISPGCG
jgi:hypothetical protein